MVWVNCLSRRFTSETEVPLPAAMRIVDLCNTASTWEPLQYVFLAVGVVGAGVGAFFIINALSEHHDGTERAPEATSPTVALSPYFNQFGGGLTASGSF